MRFRTFLIIIFIVPFFVIPDSLAKTLNVGITGDNPPWSNTAEKNVYYGFDIDIMNAIGKRLQMSINYIPMTFGEFFPAINNGKIDLAIDSIIITPIRLKNYLISYPYLVSKVQFLTKPESTIGSIPDLMNKKIGVRQSGQYKDLFEQLFNDKITLIVYDQMPLLFDALAKNKVDAIVINSPAANYLINNDPMTYKLVGDPIILGMGFGILAKKGQEQLISQINHALVEMESDGTYLSIYSNYFN